MAIRLRAVLCGVLCGLSLGLGACNEPKNEVRRTIQPDYTTRGVISARLTRFVSETGDPFEQFEFMAMFPRYRERDRDEMAALLPTHVPESDLAPDTCSRPEPSLQLSKRAASRGNVVTLVDAGDMFVRFGQGSIPIPTRTFPDLLKVIDGVIYTANPSHRVDLLPGQTYTLKTRGTDSIGAFEVLLDAPDELGDVTVDTVSPSDSIPVIARGKDVRLTWEGEGYGDEVILTLDWTDLGLSWQFSCRMKDDGEFVIPSDITEQLNSEPTVQTHEMSLSRLRQASFAAPGISFGDFSFVATTSFLVEFSNLD